MATTVTGAFTSFRKDYVDIESEVATKARASRDYLIAQLKSLADANADFPPLTGSCIAFGSLARNTKTKPLDDIDLLLLLKCHTATVSQRVGYSYSYNLTANNNTCPLWGFKYSDSSAISSIRVLNKIKSCLAGIANYSKAELHRNQEAVTLALKSYDWVFDIVPAVEVVDGQGSLLYYVIPDGSGYWKRTDPRKDSKATTDANQAHNENLLPLIRLVKAWNTRSGKPALPSYYVENLALAVFKNRPGITNLRLALHTFFSAAPVALYLPLADPKGLGPNLDAGIDADTKNKVSAAMTEAANHAGYALSNENDGNNKDAIYWWGRIFGGNFPSYG